MTAAPAVVTTSGLEDGVPRSRGEGAGEVVLERGPGAAYHVFVVMEDLMEKLKLLRFEEEFLRKSNLKAPSRPVYPVEEESEEESVAEDDAELTLSKVDEEFVEEETDNEENFIDLNILKAQRYHLVSFIRYMPDQLATNQLDFTMQRKYCFRKVERDEFFTRTIRTVKESDILNVYVAMQAQQCHLDSRSGSSGHCKRICLYEHAPLSVKHFEHAIHNLNNPMSRPEESGSMDGIGMWGPIALARDMNKTAKQEDILESTTDAAEWSLEVERVLPQLKVTIRTDNKDWRIHVDQMHQHKSGIESALKETKGFLDKLHNEITRTLEKIGSREKYINNQLENLLQEYRAAQAQLSEVTEELEKVKQEMEEKGSSMTDGAPLVKIKQSLARLKQETVEMDIRIGIVEHTLLQSKLKEKSNMSRD
ncbi:hypothetical protein P7K49_031177 [Saguinus oedipus]|uniref:Intraflagellar transport protein 57 homolog n=1 Tax=Saguinus oedipus TaxID=9490 RepID=A0ABQ9U4A0_SAGOE|nr:hypothetical protein P7K49_031177 [Saguinus oedipus]